MGAVESALMWSEKYDQLSIETNTLREKNLTIMTENGDLKENLAKLNNQLTQTRTELDEARSITSEADETETTPGGGSVTTFEILVNK